jgi:TP901 family phage tail tape measure protein
MANSLNIAYTISAIDKLSPALKKIEQQVAKLSKNLQSLNKPIAVQVNTKGAQSSIAKLKNQGGIINMKVAATTSAAESAIAKLKNQGGVVAMKVDADTSAAESAIASLKKDLNSTMTVTAKNTGGTGGISAMRMGGAGKAGLMAGITGGAMSAAGLGVAAAGAAAVAGISASVVQFAELETAQLSLAKALDLGVKDIGGYSTELANLAVAVGINQTEITGMAASYAKADSSLDPKSLAEITKLTFASSKAWDANADSVMDSFQLLKTLYKLDTSGLTSMANKIDMLGDKFGVLNEQYLTDFIAVGAANAKTIGMSADEMLAWGSTAGEMKVQASEAANALKVIGSAVLMAKAGDDQAGSAIEKLGGDFKKLDAMNPAQKLQEIMRLMNEYKGIDKTELSADIAGGNYNDVLLRMSEGNATFAKSLELTSDKSAIAGRVTKALSLEAQTLSGKYNRAMASVTNFAASIGDMINQTLFGKEVTAQFDATIANLSVAFGGAGNNIKFMEVAVFGLAFAFDTVALGIGLVIDAVSILGVVLKGVVDAMSYLASGEFKLALAAVSEAGSKTSEIVFNRVEAQRVQGKELEDKWAAIKGGQRAMRDRDGKIMQTETATGVKIFTKPPATAAVAGQPTGAAAKPANPADAQNAQLTNQSAVINQQTSLKNQEVAAKQAEVAQLTNQSAILQNQATSNFMAGVERFNQVANSISMAQTVAVGSTGSQGR